MKSIRVLSLGSDEHNSRVGAATVRAGLPLQTVASVWEALEQVQTSRCEILVIELPQADLDPSEFVASVHAVSPEAIVIFQLSDGGVGNAVRLARLGAYSCVDPSMTESEIAALLSEAGNEAVARRNHRAAANEESWRQMLVGQSAGIEDVVRTIELLAKRRCTVLITGETGTGKEVAARAIHMASDRAAKPMVALNCSAVPEHLLEAELFGHTKGAFTGAVNERSGRFEEAHEGTLFLDEIGDMPFDLQAKLLRVLQEREVQRLGSSKTIKVDVRVIAASNVDLVERIRERKFREDLYYRLNVVPLQIPPLCTRVEDIPLLVRHFVARICQSEGIPLKHVYQETLDRLMQHPWPGNIRELSNAVERAVVISGDRPFLTPADFKLSACTPQLAPSRLPTAVIPFPPQGINFAEAVGSFERALLDQALERANGNRTMAADLLRLKRTTLVSKLRVL